MKRSIFFLVIFLVAAQSVYSQIEIWPDKFACEVGQGIEIGEQLAEDPNSCYAWKAFPSDTVITRLKSAKIKVKPSKTTVYTLTVIGHDFSTLKTYQVTVQLLEGFKIVFPNTPIGACDGDKVPIKIQPQPASFPLDKLICLKNIKLSSTQLETSFGNPSGIKILKFGPINDNLESQIENAYWYSTEAVTHCNADCNYEIRGSIMLNGKKIEETQVLRVNASIGETQGSACLWGAAHIQEDSNQINMVFSGEPIIETIQLADGTWNATISQGTFKRDIKAVMNIMPNTGSQFYKMLDAEEKYHVAQFQGSKYNGKTVNSTAMAGLYNVTTIMNAVLARNPFNAITKNLAFNNAKQAFLIAVVNEIFRSNQITLTPDWRCQFEKEAKQAIHATYRLKLQCTYPYCN